MSFPLDLDPYEPLSIDLKQATLTDQQLEQLRTNIGLFRDALMFFTACSNARGLGGHTGGAYDITPELLILDAVIRGSDRVYDTIYDGAGHRVAAHYLRAALNPDLPLALDELTGYRASGEGLPGHPEPDPETGIDFASGRLGHLWADVNGVAEHTDQALPYLSSDGDLSEGTNAEAARLAVARGLNIAVFVDANDVTIEGKPSDYLPGFDVAQTLNGHGIKTVTSKQPDEGVGALYRAIRTTLLQNNPTALVVDRPMAPGTEQEGCPGAHAAVGKSEAQRYLTERGHDRAVEYLENLTPVRDPLRESDIEAYRGSTDERTKVRKEFGEALANTVKVHQKGSGTAQDEELREGAINERIRVYSADLGGSTGVAPFGERFPSCYVQGGVMERGLFSAAAGFGGKDGCQGVFATFSAFGSMIESELEMAELNNRDVLVHLSHAGVDWMADNTCHYGVNIATLDRGIASNTRLYFPADARQMRGILRRIYDDPGVRFIFSTRSPVPAILDDKGRPMYEEYEFEPGRAEVVREGTEGWIVSYGSVLYRALDAVEVLKQEGIDVGLINKPTLNVIDEQSLGRVADSSFVLFAEAQNKKTGFGNQYAKALLEEGFEGTFRHLGVTKEGQGGLHEHIPRQGLSPDGIRQVVREAKGAKAPI